MEEAHLNATEGNEAIESEESTPFQESKTKSHPAVSKKEKKETSKAMRSAPNIGIEEDEDDYSYYSDEEEEEYQLEEQLAEELGEELEEQMDHNITKHSSDSISQSELTNESEPPAFVTARIPIEAYLGKKYVVDRAPKVVAKKSIVQEEPDFMPSQTKNIQFTVIRELNVRLNKNSQLSDQTIKMTNNPHQPFVIMEQTVDYTPRKMIGPRDSGWLREPLLFNFQKNIYKSEVKSTDSQDVFNFGSLFRKTEIEAEMSSDEESSDAAESRKAISLNKLHIQESPPINKMCVKFKLKETETFVLFELVSRSATVDEHEGKLAMKVNAVYEETRARLRKSVENYCQTTEAVRTQSKEVQLPKCLGYNKHSRTSNWEYYDTLEEVKRKSEPAPTVKKVQLGKVEKIVYAEAKSDVKPILEKNFKVKDGQHWCNVGLIMQRVLIANKAMKRQVIFHDNFQSDLLSNKVDFTYQLIHLWTWRVDEMKGKSVTSLCWNKFENNILAAGYGKYNFSDQSVGGVCIWNNKNLVFPERKFKFEHPVTCVQFCKAFPNILTVGLYSGWVILINIMRNDLKIVARSMPNNKTSISPVWDVAWVPREQKEAIIECRGNGRVYEYTKRHLYDKKEIMRITKIKGAVKGISHPRRCQPYIIPLVRRPSVLCIALNPDNINLYYLGTDEGAVYSCTFQDTHQYTDMFLAHNGPVYNIQFHPACSKIFLTCGADWQIRVWADKIYSPLLTMASGVSAVQAACWCPNNPTVIAAITAKKIELWDISRRIVLPQAVFDNPNGKVNTSMIFSNCGRNLCVGDNDGNIHVYGLRNMPFTPANSELVLALALIKTLRPKRELLTNLYKLGPPFNVPRIYRNYINLA